MCALCGFLFADGVAISTHVQPVSSAGADTVATGTGLKGMRGAK